jgi:hypothetical protein
MHEQGTEMREQNDPQERAAGEIEARRRDESGNREVGQVDVHSPTNPEMHRDQTPGMS